MATVNVNIRMDEDLKRQFEAFCDEVGMTMTTAFTIYVKKVLREERIPFSVGREVYNEETRKAIQEARAGIGLSRSFSSVEELMEDLQAE